MSTRRERMLADLDKEIAEAEDMLSKLREARKALASALAGSMPTARKNTAPAVSVALPTAVPSAHEPDTRSIEEAVLAILVNGGAWAVEDVAKQLLEAGREISRATVNSALYRGSKRPDGPFERAGRGFYRLRKERQIVS